MIPQYHPNVEFERLFSIYTADSQSIGAHLTRRMTHLALNDPLLVSTGTDIALFPGSGGPPIYESFRKTTRGFIELTSVSHLGTAVPWIARLHELGDRTWQADAQRLLIQMARVRAVNSPEYWQDTVAVSAWSGLEEKIADLVDYTCRITSSFLVRALADETQLNFCNVRDAFLDPVDSVDVPVPIDDMMAATFALTFLDIAHRLIGWLRDQNIDWSKLMVLITGQAGRPTAGLTWATNNMCHLLWQASGRRLSPSRVYIAPHAAPFAVADLTDMPGSAALETVFRETWMSTRASVELGAKMFHAYPAFVMRNAESTYVDATTQVVHDMPTLHSVDDRRAIVTRMRVTLEDPAQLISNAAAHYVIDQLCATGNRPADVVIPGFTHLTYPPRQTGREHARGPAL